MCKCGRFHPFGDGRDDCHNVCRHCFGTGGNCYYAHKIEHEIIPESLHTFGNYCVCDCPEHIDRAHLWPEKYSKRETGNTMECIICNQTVIEVEFSRECKRDCSRNGEKAREVYFAWEGHDLSKHSESGEEQEGNYCEIHNLKYVDKCPECSSGGGSSGEGGGSSGGGQTDGSGEENGASGSLSDIFIIIA